MLIIKSVHLISIQSWTYLPRSGQECLSAYGVTMECHDSSVFLIWKLPLSITEALLPTVRGAILVKLAERLTPEEKNT